MHSDALSLRVSRYEHGHGEKQEPEGRKEGGGREIECKHGRKRRIRKNGRFVINGKCGVGKERKEGRKEGKGGKGKGEG